MTETQPPARGRTECGGRVWTTAAHRPSQGQEPLCCDADLPLQQRGRLAILSVPACCGSYHLLAFGSSWFTLPGRKNYFLIENLLLPH